jgi:hypothetical protein
MLFTFNDRTDFMEKYHTGCPTVILPYCILSYIVEWKNNQTLGK